METDTQIMHNPDLLFSEKFTSCDPEGIPCKPIFERKNLKDSNLIL